MDVRYINPFVSSICNVFETMVGMAVTVGKPVLKQDTDSHSDVSGVIGFSGDASGSVVLAFPSDTATKVASSFAGIDLALEHPDFADAIGELANMVAGGAKSKFEGLKVNISLPNVIVGKQHNVCPSRTFPRIVFPCSTDAGAFFVEVGMVVEQNQKKDAAQPAAAGVSS